MMASLNCADCEGDGFTSHHVMNEANRTVSFFVRRCICDGGIDGPVRVRDGETLIDRKTFEKCEAEGFKRVT